MNTASRWPLILRIWCVFLGLASLVQAVVLSHIAITNWGEFSRFVTTVLILVTTWLSVMFCALTLYRSALYGFLVGTQTVYFLAALSMAVINLGGSFIAWNDPVLYRQAQQVFCILVTVFLGIKANQARNNTDMVSTF